MNHNMLCRAQIRIVCWLSVSELSHVLLDQRYIYIFDHVRTFYVFHNLCLVFCDIWLRIMLVNFLTLSAK